jgi:hypothetical protein
MGYGIFIDIAVSVNTSQVPILTDPQIVRSEIRPRTDKPNIGIGFQTGSGMHNEVNAPNTTI